MEGITLFSGFDGAGIGMEAAGVKIVGGVELDPAIADVARTNGRPVDTADVCTADPAKWLGIEALHASPPCIRASVANSSAERDENGLKETELDRELARAVVKYLECLRPTIFTLENVYGYRKFQSWRNIIAPTLDRLGYWWTLDHVNAADYGVPQTRMRMIVRAIRGAMVPQLPEPTAWIGWYAAIEDLIPTLPESQFADWQLSRLPDELRSEFLLGAGTRSAINRKYSPADTITSSDNQVLVKAFIVPGGNANSFGIRTDDEPTARLKM